MNDGNVNEAPDCHVRTLCAYSDAFSHRFRFNGAIVSDSNAQHFPIRFRHSLSLQVSAGDLRRVGQPFEGAHPPKRSPKGRRRSSTPDAGPTSAGRSAEQVQPTHIRRSALTDQWQPGTDK